MRRRRELLHALPPARRLAAARPRLQTRFDHRRGELFQVAAGDGRIRIAREYDLTLLGQLEPAVEGATGLGGDRAVGRATTAPDRAAPPVEELERDALLRAGARQR